MNHHTQIEQNHKHEQDGNRLNASSTLANLQQQMQLLLKQHNSLSAKNSVALSAARKNNNEQKMKRDELLKQMNDLAKQISDIEQKSKQCNNDKTNTNKTFSRSTTFMILQLEKLTAENRQAVMNAANENRDLKVTNDQLFSQLDQLTAENAKLALDAATSNEQLMAENRLLLYQSEQLVKQIIHANEQMEIKNEQISEHIEKLRALVSTAEKLDEHLDNVRFDLNNQLRKRSADALEDSNDDAVCDDVLDQYTKCCVCLESYEVDPEASRENRLPIKSATCSHTLCEGCVDACFASLLASGKANARYVTCPQCRTRRAFDVQNKVVDSFLREYMISRCKAVSKRRVKSKLTTKPHVADTGTDMIVSLSSGGDSLKSSIVTPSKDNAIMAVKVPSNFELMFDGALEQHKSQVTEFLTHGLEQCERKGIPFKVIEKAREKSRYIIQRANNFLTMNGGTPLNEQEIEAALSKAENDALQMYKRQKNSILMWYRRIIMDRNNYNGGFKQT